MKRSSHRPAGHPWRPILFGTARINRAWFGKLRERRTYIKHMRRTMCRQMAMVPQYTRPDPLVTPTSIHPTRWRLNWDISIATGPGRLP